MKTVVVVGGGITGLCTMHYLKRQAEKENVQVRMILLEKNPYLGGKIHTARENGFIMETGADSMVARYPAVLNLVKELDFESELVYNETGISYIYTNNEMHAIPPESVFGIPMNIESLNASTLVSEEGKKRVLQEAEIPNTKFTKESSIGEFLEYFLGEEIVRNQIAPVLAGVYSGDLYKLSLANTLPYLIDYKNEYGSIMKGLEANREKFEREANKKFISFRNGLDSIITRLEELLPEVDIRKNVATEKVIKEGNQYKVYLENGEQINADFVVLAVPNQVVKQVLQDDELNPLLEKFTEASAITMYLGFDVPDSVLPKDGTGFIVSHNSDVVCNASTWTSRKWKHTSKNGNLLVRVFYKSSNPRYDELIQMSEEELTKVALEDIRKTIQIEEKPVVVNVTKWIDAMPRYDKDHNEALQKVVTKLEGKYPRLYIAGCSYFGVGIGACIENGKDTAEKIVKEIVEQ